MPSPLTTILNVNDHEQTRYMVSRMLRMAGFEVLEAGSGEEALRLAGLAPDIIVLDVKLPDISGFEVCRMLKTRPESSSIFILQTSATFVTPDKKVEGLNSGADGYLTHPFSAAELIATVQSMLRLRQAERELRARNEALAEADRRKDEFLAMLAHELRNPLAAMASAVPLIPAYRNDDTRLRRVCGVLDRQTKHLARLIDDLLDVSRITRGKIELRRTPVDLGETLKEALELSRSLFAKRKQEVRVTLPDPPVYVEGDGARLQQILTNLLDNAAKYSDEGALTTIQLGRVPCGSGEEVVLTVSDTGIGIAPEVLPHVFELFMQADESLARTRGGMGIGLTLVKKLVELHGGRIVARSEGLGRGSEFELRFPLTARHPVATEKPQELKLPTRGCSILLVDDNEDIVEMLQSILRDAGHTVEMARDGAAALQKARAGQFDVAIVDIGLPGMDGYEVAERLRGISSAPLYLIALTGYGGPEQRRRALGAGFERHLVKPVDSELLLQVVSQACHHRAPAQRAV